MKRAAANFYLQTAVAKADEQMTTRVLKERSAIKDQEAAGLIQLILYYRDPNLQQAMLQIRQLTGGDSRQMASLLQQVLRQPDERLVTQLIGLMLAFDDPYSAFGYFQQQISLYIQGHKENDKASEVRLLRTVGKILLDDVQRAATAERGIYLDTVANKTEEDALQFRMYLDIADKMGIQLDDEAIQNLIRVETNDMLSRDDAKEVDQRVRGNQFRSLSAEQIRLAVGDEFRVAMVYRTVRGGQFSNTVSIPAAMTPYAFFEFFKDKRTELTWDVLDVSVAEFLDLVKEEPTEKERGAFFDKNRNTEYNPVSNRRA